MREMPARQGSKFRLSNRKEGRKEARNRLFVGLKKERKPEKVYVTQHGRGEKSIQGHSELLRGFCAAS